MNEVIKVKLWFGSLAIFGFFTMALLIFKFDIQNDLITFAFGQASIVFVLVFRHVFKSGFKAE